MCEPTLSPELKKTTTKRLYEKNKTNSNRGQYNIPDQCSEKLSRSSKTKSEKMTEPRGA